MIKFSKLVTWMVVSVFAFSACNKEANLIDTPESEEYLYAFAINTADNDASVETKASLASDEKGLYLKWEDGDSFGAYATGSTGNSNNRRSRVSVEGEHFTLYVASTVKFENGADVYTYFPFYNGESNDRKRADIHIESVQTQKNTGFDASVMPMVGEPFTTDVSLVQNSETAVGKIRFANLGAIIEFNIYSATPIEEQIKSVEFRAENTTPAGNFKLDLTSVVFSEEESLKLDGGTENTVKTILETPVAIPSSKDSGVKVHMVVAPGEYQGAVVVTTDAHTYTFELASPKQFNRSRVKPLNADLSKATVGDLPHEETWELVTRVEDFTDGTYVIVSSDKISYLLNKSISKNPGSGNAVFINEKLAEVKEDARWIATVSGDGLQFESYVESGNYLCASNEAQGIKVGKITDTDLGIWTFVEDNIFGCIATAHPNIEKPRYLALFTSNVWRYYQYGSSDLKVAANFYKLEDNRVVLSAPVLNVDGSRISWEAVENAGSYLVTIDKTQQTIKETEIDLKDLAAGYYTVSVVAVPDNTTLYKPSPAATAEEVKVGDPALEMPVLQKGTTTANSITVYWESIKDADGYAAKIVDADGKECGSQNVETPSVTFDDLTANTEYMIYVRATDTSDKFAASEQAEIKVTTAEEGYVETILNATFTVSDFSQNITATKGPITATFAQGNGTTPPTLLPEKSPQYVRLYQQKDSPNKGGTLTIKSTDNNIKKIEIEFNSNQNYLASEDGIFSGGVWASPTAVESVDFYCNGTSSSQRADIVSVTVYYVSTEGGSGDSGNSGEGGDGGDTTDPEQPSETKIAKLTGDDMSVMENAGTGYGTPKSVNLNGFVWETNGFQEQTRTNMIQLRVRTNNSGVTYLKLPDFDGFIKSITLMVTDTNATEYSKGSNPTTAVIAFQNGNTPNEDIVVSGTATNKSITLNLSDKAVKTGYIVSNNGPFRIWEVSVEYN